VRPAQRDSVWFGGDMAQLFDWMQGYQGDKVAHWIDESSVHA